MNSSLSNLIDHVLLRLSQVQKNLGMTLLGPLNDSTPFKEILDSMAMVEFLAIMAEDCAVDIAAIEDSVQKKFTNVGELAACMLAAGLLPKSSNERVSETHSSNSPFDFQPSPLEIGQVMDGANYGWLAATSVRLPDMAQSADSVNGILGRPKGWLERHAGIRSRRLWHTQDPVSAAVEAARECLERASVEPDEVGELFITSEAPPQLAGLGALLHHELQLRPEAGSLEIGGACTGFLAALHMAQAMLPKIHTGLIVTVEAPSQYLVLEPGEAGEAAALFGDAAAACLISANPSQANSTPLSEVILGVDGSGHGLIQIHRGPSGWIHLQMNGKKLAARAIQAMAKAGTKLMAQYRLNYDDLQAVVAHGGNGRMPPLLARRLGFPPEQVWSETATTGNLGSASLPVGWHAHQPAPKGPILWTAVGAGLTWGSVLSGFQVQTHLPPGSPL
ncbi:MAG TPA: 3-oxoacyl-[acyl-carrier-protein] synthase III C-terminal domain-containing protein [Gemmataceae bacterium]|nr:3-oxoacyl-[acyl-carrier-protein] synthase III C-terminal domain-containing protein [Gemmataceae bacterium]